MGNARGKARSSLLPKTLPARGDLLSQGYRHIWGDGRATWAAQVCPTEPPPPGPFHSFGYSQAQATAMGKDIYGLSPPPFSTTFEINVKCVWLEWRILAQHHSLGRGKRVLLLTPTELPRKSRRRWSAALQGCTALESCIL